jgi:hypothetical protein
MSLRIDTTELIAGAYVVGNTGLGVLGSVVRSATADGAHGAGFLYNDWQAGDDDKEFRGLIVTPPASGTLFAYEDGSFDFDAPGDGSYSFTYRLFVDGVDLGTAVASFTIGAGSGVTAAVAGAGTVTYTGTAAVAASIVDAPPPGGALTNDEMRQMFVWVSEIARIHGLVVGSPLVVTPTSRQAGPISQSISESGSTVTVSRA